MALNVPCSLKCLWTGDACWKERERGIKWPFVGQRGLHRLAITDHNKGSKGMETYVAQINGFILNIHFHTAELHWDFPQESKCAPGCVSDLDIGTRGL